MNLQQINRILSNIVLSDSKRGKSEENVFIPNGKELRLKSTVDAYEGLTDFERKQKVAIDEGIKLKPNL